MTSFYPVVLIPSEEGWAASCPALPGCFSQGDTEAEARANITIAIREWLDTATELAHAEEASECGKYELVGVEV
jgi:predicted RNase H-like HicB family nuclease